MADIVHQLQTLTGNTLGEVFRMLNVIIKNNGDSIKSNLSIIFSSFDSNDYFQKLVKIRLIDQYKCHDEVLKILKSDDSFSISHVLQQCLWFFQTCSTSPEVLVNSVFPCMSCSTRNKVIKKYSKYLKDKNTADKIFVLLKARYGLSVALFLLPACSEGFIKEVLEKSSMKIPVFILNSVFDLYPTTVINYISHLLDCKEKNKRVIRNLDLSIYEGLVLHIVSKDPIKSFSLLVKYNKINRFPLKLGKRSTRHLIMSDYDSFKNDFKIYSDIIDWKKVGARLRVEQLVDLQARLLPQTPTDFIQCFKNSSDFMVILSHIKSDKAVQKTLVNFKNVYGKEIVAYLDRFNEQQVAKLPPNLSEAWAEKRLPETEDHRRRAEYTKLLPVDKAIPQLKKLIQAETDSGVRGFMVECLCDKVKESNDPSLVGPLFEYILKRHRNEKAHVKEHAFSVLEDFPRVMELPEEAWKLVEELYNLMMVNKEVDIGKFVQVISKQIEWRLMKGLSAQEYLEKLMKHRTFYFIFSVCEKSPFEKFCLCWFINWYGKNNAKSDQRNDDLNWLFSRISGWNSKHPDDKISIPEWLMEEIKLMFADEKTYHYTKTNILEAVRKNSDLVSSFYEQIFPKYVDDSILMHYMRSKPVVLKDSSVVDKLLTLSLRSYRLFLMRARLHSPFGIPQFFSKYCISTLKTPIKRGEDGEEEPGVPYSVKRNAIFVLSLLLPVNEYLQVISEYYPKDKAVQDFSVAATEKFEIQQEIASSFKEINNPSHVLDSLLKFTCGDFLKFVVGSINSVMCRSPEIEILPLLNTRIDGPVSVKKHFIRVYFKIAPIQNTLELLLNLFKNEKNVSVRLLLLKSSLKFFLSEPCEETFSVLRAVVEQLNESDEVALETLFSNEQVEKVPNSFLANYLLLLWDVASTKKEKLVDKRRNDVISMISPSILRVISEEFVDTLISQVLGKGFNLDLDREFVIHYLIFSKDFHQFDKRLSLVMNTLKASLAQWDLPDFNIRNVFLVKKTLSMFIDRLIAECFKMHLEKDIEGPLLPLNEILRRFKASLLLVLKEDDILKEAVELDLAMLFPPGTPLSENVMSKLVNFVESLANNTVAHYGNDAIGLITSGVSYVSGLWAAGHSIDIEKELLSLAELFIANDSINCKLIGIGLLPRIVNNENKSKYKTLVNSILQISKSLRSTKIVINDFLVNLASEDGDEDHLDDEFEASVEQLDISEGGSEEL